MLIEWNGYWINDLTGEAICTIEEGKPEEDDPFGDPEDVLISMADAEDIMERRFNHEAALTVIKQKIATYSDNLTMEINRHKRSIEYIDHKYGEQLEALAKENKRPGMKSVNLGFGKLGWQKIQPKVEIADGADDIAIEFMEKAYPEKVKRSLFAINDLFGSPLPEDIFVKVPGGEKFFIRTHLKKDAV